VNKGYRIKDLNNRFLENGSGQPIKFSKVIDHTLLKAQATERDIRMLCLEARKFGFYSVCVNPANIRLCKKLLKGSGIKICSVIDFPLGASKAEIKALQAREALRDGADEIDLVINIGALKSEKHSIVLDGIKKTRVVSRGKILKVIIETGLLTKNEKLTACRLVKKARADFVKTSTGFAGGARASDVILLKRAVGDSIGVKASGGIKTAADMLKMLNAGASRIGTSSGTAIMRSIEGTSDECK